MVVISDYFVTSSLSSWGRARTIFEYARPKFNLLQYIFVFCRSVFPQQSTTREAYAVRKRGAQVLLYRNVPIWASLFPSYCIIFMIYFMAMYMLVCVCVWYVFMENRVWKTARSSRFSFHSIIIQQWWSVCVWCVCWGFMIFQCFAYEFAYSNVHHRHVWEALWE